MKRVYLIVRGHERGACLEPDFARFKERVTSFCDAKGAKLEIHVHTWSESEAKSSHRPLDRRGVRAISEREIREYIGGRVCSVAVEDDAEISLRGRLEGMIGGIPIRAWKNMWHGIAAATAAASASNSAAGVPDVEALAVCVRLDVFSNMESRVFCKITEDRIMEMLRNMLSRGCRPGGVYFFSDREINGIDNCFAGRLSAVKRLVDRFNLELDDLAKAYPDVHHQEFMVFREAQKLERAGSA
jgi:hypothetical protein